MANTPNLDLQPLALQDLISEDLSVVNSNFDKIDAAYGTLDSTQGFSLLGNPVGTDQTATSIAPAVALTTSLLSGKTYLFEATVFAKPSATLGVFSFNLGYTGTVDGKSGFTVQSQAQASSFTSLNNFASSGAIPVVAFFPVYISGLIVTTGAGNLTLTWKPASASVTYTVAGTSFYDLRVA